MRELDVLGRRATETPGVVAEDSVAGGDKERSQLIPGPEVRDSRVKKDDRRAVSFIDGEEPAPSGVDLALAHGVAQTSPVVVKLR